MERHLDLAYAKGWIQYEADIQDIASAFLRGQLEQLEKETGIRRIVGSKAKHCGYFPDIVIYSIPAGRFREFLQSSDGFAEVVVEIKYRTHANDQDKLTRIQHAHSQLFKGIVGAWIIYGDHFNPDVNRRTYETHLRREASFRKWEQDLPGYRGVSILRFGIIRKTDTPDMVATRAAFNDVWWVRGAGQ